MGRILSKKSSPFALIWFCKGCRKPLDPSGCTFPKHRSEHMGTPADTFGSCVRLPAAKCGWRDWGGLKEPPGLFLPAVTSCTENSVPPLHYSLCWDELMWKQDPDLTEVPPTYHLLLKIYIYTIFYKYFYPRRNLCIFSTIPRFFPGDLCFVVVQSGSIITANKWMPYLDLKTAWWLTVFHDYMIKHRFHQL